MQATQQTAMSNQAQDPSYLVNMMMSGYMMNAMGQLKEANLSFQTIFMFILMMSMPELKKLILYLVEESKTKIPEWLSQAKNYVINFISGCFRKKVKEEPYVEPKEIEKGYSVTINLTPNLAMMNALYKYIYTNKIGSLENSFSLEANTLQTSTTKVSYSDCSFDLGDSITASLDEPLHFVVKNEDNSLANMLVEKQGEKQQEKKLEYINIANTIMYQILKDDPKLQERINNEINEYTYEEIEKKYSFYVPITYNNNYQATLNNVNTSIKRKLLY